MLSRPLAGCVERAQQAQAEPRPATAAESARLWPTVVAAMPSYAAYRTATAREIPLVLVTAVGRAR
ncbi:nitroreductase/quinone reductase family protein [Streptomyces sp. NPDC002187]|uniref:nitroreductase/quinone reductase family protein n=1 Tax=Streptomyces sp. NPDC002187 TaxID=3364637 RepID=UPI0036A5F78C